jgi:hypothetical protein
VASIRIVEKSAKSSTNSGAGATDVYKPTWFAYKNWLKLLLLLIYV